MPLVDQLLSASSPASPVGLSAAAPSLTPAVARIAASDPTRRVDVIVQLQGAADGAALVRSVGGQPGRELSLIDGLEASMTASAARRLAAREGVHAVSLDAPVRSSGWDGGFDKDRLGTAYNQSIGSDDVWFNNDGVTGRGIGVAVLDTGIAGDLPDFRRSGSDARSRVVASAVVNPGATSAGDTHGHGTHIAGLVAGNGGSRPAGDTLDGR